MTVTDVTAVSDPFDARGPTVSADGTTAFATVNYSVDPLESEHAEEAEEAAEIAREHGVEAELTGTLVARGDPQQRGTSASPSR